MSSTIGTVLLVARREWTLLRRGRAARSGFGLLLAVAWIPLFSIPLRAGTLGVASFSEVVPLALAVSGVTLPLLGLLAGADVLASELEDGSLVSVLTIPIPRSACLWGKCLGRTAVLLVVYGVSFGSAALAITLTHGSDGGLDYAVLAAAGLLLSLTSGAVGCALGVGGTGRLRVFGAALLTWLLLVFVVDAVLLAGLVMLAPPAPQEIGSHGHGELSAPAGSSASSDDGAGDRRRASWLMATSPVSLFRMTALSLAPGLQHRLSPMLSSGRAPWIPLLVGWALWIVLPLHIALLRFRRTPLR